VTSLVACSEAARLDAATSLESAIPPILLMEDASLRLWDAIEPIARARGAGTAGFLLAVCGPGNNGGDALAVLRHARFAGLARIAAILAREPGEQAAVFAVSLKAIGVRVVDWGSDRSACLSLFDEASLILDGLSGSGLSGSLREPQASLLEAANAVAGRGRAAIASIDLPSGLSDAYQASWPLTKATWTFSVEPRKACIYFPIARGNCGEIIPIRGVFPCDSAFAQCARLLGKEDLPALAPLPEASAYKGSRGRVAVFAGSEGASGAAVLSSRACLAAGAGLVSLFASRELFPIVAPMLEGVMVKREPEAFDASRYDAVLAGPGWGRGSDRRERLAALLGAGLPIVLDADAIYLFRELVDSGMKPNAPVILTPHPGEFSALTGVDAGKVLSSPATALAPAARELGAVIILKSHVTWIASPSGELAVWDGMECGLGTAGSGDVLAGLAAGLLARAHAARIPRSRAEEETTSSAADPAFAAARAAVVAHGVAGRRARAERGWFEAGAIIEEAAKVLGDPKAFFP
jgi:ADP-dependent NAD(P)H-hydrate dehydratase / NAD(P)H-hydrate epimerase